MDLTKEEWDREFEQRSKMGVWGGALRPIATNVDLEPVLKFKDEQYKTNQESTVLSNLGTVAGNVLKGAGRGVLGAAKAAIDYNIEQHKKADPNYRPYNDFATDASDTLQSGVNALERTEIKTDSATEKLAYDLLEGAGQLAVQIALASATGGTTAAAYMATITAGDQYLELRKQGVDAERAAQAGLINAPMQLALEKIGIGKIMNKLPKGSPLRKRMTDILVTGITEGVTEGLQEIPEQLTNIWAKDKNADVSSVAKAWQGDWQENVKEIGYSGLIGGILGGGAKGAMHIVDANVRNYVQAKVNDAQKEFIAQNIEQIKKNGINPNDAAVYINANSDNGTITVEAKDVQGYMQTATPEKIAKELGVTVDEVNKAAAAGQDIDINIGNFTAACSTNEGLFEATKDGMLFNANGELSSRDLAMQGEIARESTLSEREAVELDNEIEAIVKSAKEAGVAEKQAEDLGLIIESRAMIANPENPAEWLRKNKLRFENAGKAGKNKGGWLQSVGEHAKSANKEQLKAAKEMAANGADEKEIYKKTGWHRGVDGKWRFEIPDNIDGIDIDVLQSQGDEGISLQDLYHNDALFAAYPELKNVNIFKETMEGNILGYANGNENKIALRKEIVEIRALKNFADFMGRVKSDIESSNVEDKEAIVSLIDKAVANPSAVTDADIKTISSAISDQFYNDNIKSIDLDSLLFGAEPGDEAPETKAKETFDYIKNYVENIEQSRNKLKRKFGEVLTHEIQHIIQAQEGFAKGGNQRSVRKNLDEAGVGYNPELKDLDLYWNLAGEQEARRTGTLAQMQSEMRRLKEQESPDAKKIEELQNKIDELVLGTNDKDSAIVYFGDKPVVSYSEEGTVEKGQVAPQDDGSYIVSLFKGADASTVIHETGHYFVDTLVEEALANPDNKQLNNDARILLEYAGTNLEAWRNGDVDSKRPAHEILANAFETYIMDGKAPSTKLRKALSRFSNWLKNIYSRIMRSEYAKDINDDVRGVFDRMLAPQEEIDAMAKMEGHFQSLPKELTGKLSDASKESLKTKILKAREKAVDILTKKYMENFSAERREAIKKYKEEVTPAVREEVEKIQAIQAKEAVAEAFGKQREKGKESYFSKANPVTVARKYKHAIGSVLPNYADELKWVQQDIEHMIGDTAMALESDVQDYKDLQPYWVDAKTKEVVDVSNMDNKELLEKEKAGTLEKHTADTEHGWISIFKKENGRVPNKADIEKLAVDYECGIDTYNMGAEVNLPPLKAEQQSVYDDNKKKLDNLLKQREELKTNKDLKYLVDMAKRSALSDEERTVFDVVADKLGYDSGDAMATAILKAPTKERLVRERVNDLVHEKFPDYAQDRKLAEKLTREAIYNEESAELLALENVIIQDALLKEAGKDRAKKYSQIEAKIMKNSAEIMAEETIRSMNIGEAVRSRRFMIAERRAAANAKKAAKKGNIEEALQFKRQQLLNHALARKSVQLAKEFAAAQRFVKKQLRIKKTKANWENEKHFVQTCALLERMGLTRKDYDPSVRTQTLREYVEEMKTNMSEDGDESFVTIDIADWLLDENIRLENAGALNIDQFRDVVNALKNIRAVAKQERKMNVIAAQQKTEDVENLLLQQLDEMEDVYNPRVGQDERKGFLKRTADKVRIYRESSYSADSMYLALDGWKDGGVFQKMIYSTINVAANKRYVLTQKYQTDYAEAYNKWCPDNATKKKYSEFVAYEELGDGTEGSTGSIDRHTMVSMLANFGSKSNIERLCETPPIGLENCQLWVKESDMISRKEALAMTRDNIANFLSKHITKEDIEFAQARINAASQFWEALQQVEINTRGFSPKKVDAESTLFKLADGTEVLFEGGYLPLRKDTRLASVSGQEEDGPLNQNERQGRNYYTNTGSSKSRTHAKYAVSLAPGAEMKAVEDTINDICFREIAIDLRKILRNKDIMEAMTRKMGQNFVKLFKEHIEASINPDSMLNTAVAEDLLSKAADWLRRAAVATSIMGSLKISIQNYSNIVLYGNSVDGFTHADTLVALFNGVKNFNNWNDINEVCNKSAFMRERMETVDFTMREIKNRNDLSTIEKEAARWGGNMLAYTDMMTAKPVFYHAYCKKVHEGATEQEAIDFAETVVRRTLGSSRVHDVSSMQRGSSMMRLFVMFQGFFNTQFNQWEREAHVVANKWRAGQKKDAIMRVTSFAASKWFLCCVLNIALGFENPFKDEDDDDEKLSKLNQELLKYPLSLGGWVGGFANAGMQYALGINKNNYSITPSENILKTLLGSFNHAGKVMRGEKEVFTQETAEVTANTAAVLFKMPKAPFTIIFNMVDIANDEMDFELRDLLGRRPKAERKHEY